MSRCRGSNSRQYERNAWFKPLVHAAAGACNAATLPFEWSERLRESKPGSVLLSDNSVFLHRGRVRIAERPAPFSILVRFAKIESLADDWVGTGVCKLSSSLCCYDWLSMSAVLSIRVFPLRKHTYFFISYWYEFNSLWFSGTRFRSQTQQFTKFPRHLTPIPFY